MPDEHRVPSLTRRWIRRGIIGFVVLSIFAVMVDFLVIPHVMAGAIVRAPNADRVIDPDQDREGLPADLRASFLRLEAGPPDASLAALCFSPTDDVPPKGTLLVLHGLNDNMASHLGTGVFLSGLGYRVVLIDQRGQGRSTGRCLTYGVRESQDLVQWLDNLEAIGLLAPPVGALGYSYGGAVALQFAGRDPRVKAIVSVSAFSSLREVLPPYAARFAPGVAWWFGERHFDRALAIVGERADFEPGEADAAGAAARTAARILIVHGRDDRLVPLAHAHRIHRAAGERGELVELDGDHLKVTGDESGTVRQHAVRWFERWLKTE